MNVSSLNCPTCGGPIDSNDTRTPTIKCKFCGTTLQNPFYKDDSGEQRIAMPVININVGTPDSQITYGHPMRSVEPTKSWNVTFLLAVFLGIFGAHRFYTGHLVIGIVQLVTLGFGGIWTFIDIILILTGNFRDSSGAKLASSRFGKAIGCSVVIPFIGACIGLYMIGQNASKVDVPADHGWITGADRCIGSSTFGDVVLPDNISIWEGWGDDLGNILGTVKHDTPVSVLEARRDSTQDITYYKVQTDGGLKGWVSEQFIQFQPLSEGTVPRTDC